MGYSFFFGLIIQITLTWIFWPTKKVGRNSSSSSFGRARTAWSTEVSNIFEQFDHHWRKHPERCSSLKSCNGKKLAEKRWWLNKKSNPWGFNHQAKLIWRETVAPGDVYLEQTNHFWILLMGALTWGVILEPQGSLVNPKKTTWLLWWMWGVEDVAMWQCGMGMEDEHGETFCTKVGKCFFPESHWTSKDWFSLASCLTIGGRPTKGSVERNTETCSSHRLRLSWRLACKIIQIQSPFAHPWTINFDWILADGTIHFYQTSTMKLEAPQDMPWQIPFSAIWSLPWRGTNVDATGRSMGIVPWR